MARVAILASGKGSNAKSLIDHFSKDLEIEVVVVGSNRKAAGVLDLAAEASIEAFHFTKDQMNSGHLLSELQSRKVDWVLLSGFLLKIPAEIIENFEGKMMNIHPSLLPKFGGKGMYGMNVHKAVLEAKEAESGMTIHVVTEDYDEGDVVFQASVDISDCKTAEDIASKVLALEHEYYPSVASAVIKG